jgi:hypothetical protein
MKGASFILIHAIKENHGMIGQWFILRKQIILGRLWKNYYPSRLLGHITTNNTQEAVIQCSVNPSQWNTIQQNFIVEIQLDINFNVSFVTVPIKSIVHPLCVFPDDGDQSDKYFFGKFLWKQYSNLNAFFCKLGFYFSLKNFLIVDLLSS